MEFVVISELHVTIQFNNVKPHRTPIISTTIKEKGYTREDPMIIDEHTVLKNNNSGPIYIKTYKNIHLTQNDKDSLADGQWVSDGMLQAMLYTLDLPAGYFIPTIASAWKYIENKAGGRFSRDDAKGILITNLLILYNSGGNHWIFIHAYILPNNTCNIDVYDSSPEPRKIQDNYRNIINMFNDLNGNLPARINRIQHVECSKQQDGYNCAIFAFNNLIAIKDKTGLKEIKVFVSKLRKDAIAAVFDEE